MCAWRTHAGTVQGAAATLGLRDPGVCALQWSASCVSRLACTLCATSPIATSQGWLSCPCSEADAAKGCTLRQASGHVQRSDAMHGVQCPSLLHAHCTATHRHDDLVHVVRNERGGLIVLLVLVAVQPLNPVGGEEAGGCGRATSRLERGMGALAVDRHGTVCQPCAQAVQQGSCNQASSPSCALAPPSLPVAGLTLP